MGRISTAELLANLSRIKRREHRTHLGYGWEGYGQWAIQKEYKKADFRENTEGIYNGKAE